MLDDGYPKDSITNGYKSVICERCKVVLRVLLNEPSETDIYIVHRFFGFAAFG